MWQFLKLPETKFASFLLPAIFLKADSSGNSQYNLGENSQISDTLILKSGMSVNMDNLHRSDTEVLNL
jgi:hypothetical protein